MHVDLSHYELLALADYYQAKGENILKAFSFDPAVRAKHEGFLSRRSEECFAYAERFRKMAKEEKQRSEEILKKDHEKRMEALRNNKL